MTVVNSCRKSAGPVTVPDARSQVTVVNFARKHRRRDKTVCDVFAGTIREVRLPAGNRIGLWRDRYITIWRRTGHGILQGPWQVVVRMADWS